MPSSSDDELSLSAATALGEPMSGEKLASHWAKIPQITAALGLLHPNTLHLIRDDVKIPVQLSWEYHGADHLSTSALIPQNAQLSTLHTSVATGINSALVLAEHFAFRDMTVSINGKVISGKVIVGRVSTHEVSRIDDKRTALDDNGDILSDAVVTEEDTGVQKINPRIIGHILRTMTLSVGPMVFEVKQLKTLDNHYLNWGTSPDPFEETLRSSCNSTKVTICNVQGTSGRRGTLQTGMAVRDLDEFMAAVVPVETA